VCVRKIPYKGGRTLSYLPSSALPASGSLGLISAYKVSKKAL